MRLTAIGEVMRDRLASLGPALRVSLATAERSLQMRRLRFLALNLAGLVLFSALVIVPFVSHIASECEEISEGAEQLARLRALVGERGALSEASGQVEGVFLSAREERLASADLQAMLTTFTQQAGLQLVGLRSMTPHRSPIPRAIAVGLELEGTPAGLRDALEKIEAARPMLMVTGLVLRPSVAGQDGPLRAELTIQGALHPLPARSADGEQP